MGDGRFASSFLLLGIGLLEASKKANLSFKSLSPKPPFETAPGQFLHSQNDYTHTFYDLGIDFPITHDICYAGRSGRNFNV